MRQAFVRLLTLILAIVAPSAAQGSFVNYESAVVHPLRLSGDGNLLFVVNTPDNRLAVYDLANPAGPRLVREIPVGLEPVSVTPRTSDEVWVVNSLSDSVSVVSISRGVVIDTIRVGDEPADAVFAGGRAFVTASASDAVHVFDAATRALLGTIQIFGKDPRALAVDVSGAKVYVLVHRSGNGSTIVPEPAAPPPPLPTNPQLPNAPGQALIVDAADPAFQSQIPYSLPDHDVVEIDVASLAITQTWSGIGTINFDMAVHPVTGELFVANTQARNLVRFEPALRGHVIDSRVTRISPGVPGSPSVFDLNPGVNYSQLPNLAAKADALAEPVGIVVDAAAGLLYVAAHGTDRIGILDAAGNILGRIEVGMATGSTVDTLNKRGPRGLALHPVAPILYVFNRLSLSLSVVDTQAQAVIAEHLLQDPTPSVVQDGRRFLYDARLSGNGTVSCASCHVDGDIDGLAWDLGDPGGSLAPPPTQPFPFNLALVPFHPMKGPMTTQTLRGLQAQDPFHWRGDRADLAAFNPAFASLLGGTPLGATELAPFVAYLGSIAFPPNPNQNLDRSYATQPGNANAATGLAAFQASVANILGLPASCATCHALPSGSNGMVINAGLIQEPQQMKVAQLRNLYRKEGMVSGPGAAKSGFGFIHDGSLATLTAFVNLPVFNAWPNNTKNDIVAFLRSFDTGTAPAVGYQVTVDAGNAQSAAVSGDVALLESQAAAGNCDLVVKGDLDGVPHGLVYDSIGGVYLADGPGLGPWVWIDLSNQASSGQAVWTFTGVPAGSGTRIGIDRDGDGSPDADDGLVRYGNSTPGCGGDLALFGNGKPRIGNSEFGLVAGGAPPGAPGILVLSSQPAAIPALGLTVLVDFLGAPWVWFPLQVAPSGFAVLELPLPGDPALVGVGIYAQAVFADPCGPAGWASTDGLHLTVRP